MRVISGVLLLVDDSTCERSWIVGLADMKALRNFDHLEC